MNIGILLRNPFQRLVDEIHDELARAGYPEIRPSHGNVFQFIGKNGARMTTMAEKAQMTKQSMSYLVKDLEENGYIRRAADPADKRAVIFQLTAKGWKVVDVAEKALAKVQKNWETRMGKKSYAALWKLLTTLNEQLEEK